MKIVIEFEDQTDSWFVTSPSVSGLHIAGDNLVAVISEIPKALLALRRKNGSGRYVKAYNRVWSDDIAI